MTDLLLKSCFQMYNIVALETCNQDYIILQFYPLKSPQLFSAGSMPGWSSHMNTRRCCFIVHDVPLHVQLVRHVLLTLIHNNPNRNLSSKFQWNFTVFYFLQHKQNEIKLLCAQLLNVHCSHPLHPLLRLKCT